VPIFPAVIFSNKRSKYAEYAQTRLMCVLDRCKDEEVHELTAYFHDIKLVVK